MEPENTIEQARAAILQAAAGLVPFEGWSEAALSGAIAESGVAEGLARALFPRGGVDLALGFHQAGDAAMLARLAATDLAAMKMRARIATALRFRLEASGARELVRRASALFALPGHGADGARAIWGTADAIWRALGDTDTDLNWYSKRASLGAVYGAAVLYWLGDDSPDQSATWDFIDRRIDNVMQVEKLKARLRENPLAKAVLAGPLGFLARIRAPQHRDDLPGSLTPRQP